MAHVAGPAASLIGQPLRPEGTDPTDFCAMFAAREAASDRRTGVRLVRTVRWCYPDRGAHLRGTEWATWWCVALALAAC